MIKIEAATRCSCGRAVTVACDATGVWVTLCYDCYDPTEDASDRAHVVGIAETPDESLWAWQDAHDAAHEVTWELVDLFGDIARQVSDEAGHQRGWTLRDSMNWRMETTHQSWGRSAAEIPLAR